MFLCQRKPYLTESKEAGDQVLWLSGERVFQAEEAASAQDLEGEYVWCVQGMARS